MKSFVSLSAAALTFALAQFVAAQTPTPDPAALPIPTGVSATASATDISITWHAGSGTPAGTTYNIYRGVDDTPPDTTSTSLDVLVFPNAPVDSSGLGTKTDTGAKPGTTYNYVVVAVNGTARSDASKPPVKAKVPTPADKDTGTSSSTNPLSVDCPANTSNVINNCVVIKDYKQLSDSGAWPVDADTGAMTFPLPPNLSTCSPNSADATLLSVVKFNQDQSAATPRWYLYEPKPGYKKGIPSSWSAVDFNNPSRLYGITKLQIVAIILNAATLNPQATYVIQSTKAVPTNVSNFLALLSVVGAPTPGAEKGGGPYNLVGCRTVDTGYSTSSIQVTANVPDGKKTKLLTSSQTITNEAKAWWDVSFALPIKKASALQYDSTAGTVTASQVNKQSLFAAFDYYPLRTDLKAAYSWSPAIFGGVSLASQPLHSILLGVSIHFSMVSVYTGALMIKQQQLKGLTPGSPGTPSQVSSATSYGYQPSFSVGIKLSTRSTVSTLKSAK